MTTTTNLGLKKPASSDLIDISALNDNSDAIDNYAGQVNMALDGKQDTLTFDTTPTADSTNPVTSGGVKTDQDRQDALEAEDRAALAELIDSGAKNLCHVIFDTKTAGGITVTNNGDGSITLNGTRSGNDFIPIYSITDADVAVSTQSRYSIPEGKYVVAKTGVSGSRIQVLKHNGTDVVMLANSDSNIEFTYYDANAYPYICIRVWVKSESSFDNAVVKPMLCTKAAWDISQEYVPYRPSYDELIARIEALEGGS